MAPDRQALTGMTSLTVSPGSRLKCPLLWVQQSAPSAELSPAISALSLHSSSLIGSINYSEPPALHVRTKACALT